MVMLVWIVSGALAWLVASVACGLFVGRAFGLGSGTSERALTLAGPSPVSLARYDRRRAPTVPLPPVWERRTEARPHVSGTERRRRLSA
jgi:hypothetical protein